MTVPVSSPSQETSGELRRWPVPAAKGDQAKAQLTSLPSRVGTAAPTPPPARGSRTRRERGTHTQHRDRVKPPATASHYLPKPQPRKGSSSARGSAHPTAPGHSLPARQPETLPIASKQAGAAPLLTLKGRHGGKAAPSSHQQPPFFPIDSQNRESTSQPR